MGRIRTTVLVAMLGAASCTAGNHSADVPGGDLVLPADPGGADVPGDVPGVDSTSDLSADLPPADVPPADVPPEVSIPEFLGGDRPAALFVPDDYDPRKAWPLLVLLHGYSASGFMQDAYMGVGARVTELGFLFLRPDGTVDGDGFQFWNASPSCCDFFGSGVDDVRYLRGIIDEAKARLNVDPDRVYLMGHSNGGYMSLRMACDASDQVSGILSLAGAIAKETVEAGGCTPARPVSVVLVHGTLDDDVEYAGDDAGNHPALGAEAVRDLWKGLDGCTGDPVAGTPRDLDPEVEGQETRPEGWASCAQGTSVSLWPMVGAGHVPFFDAAGQDALLEAVLGLRRDPPAAR